MVASVRISKTRWLTLHQDAEIQDDQYVSSQYCLSVAIATFRVLRGSL